MSDIGIGSAKVEGRALGPGVSSAADCATQTSENKNFSGRKQRTAVRFGGSLLVTLTAR
jgi:hypothetical protein